MLKHVTSGFEPDHNCALNVKTWVFDVVEAFLLGFKAIIMAIYSDFSVDNVVIVDVI